MRRALISFAVLIIVSGCETMSKVDSGLYNATNSMAARDRVTGQRTVNLAGRAKQIEVADRNAGELLAKYDASGAKRDAALDPVAYARIQKIVTRVHAVAATVAGREQREGAAEPEEKRGPHGLRR